MDIALQRRKVASEMDAYATLTTLQQRRSTMPEKTTGGRADVFSPLSMPFGLEALMEINRPALTAMAQVNGKVYENLAAMNKSWAEFLNRRLKEDLGVASQLAGCKSVQDVYGLYTDYLQTAMSDYRAEIEEMGKLGKTLADDTMEAMQHARSTRADESNGNSAGDASAPH
jgi:hypothetical protein